MRGIFQILTDQELAASTIGHRLLDRRAKLDPRIFDEFSILIGLNEIDILANAFGIKSLLSLGGILLHEIASAGDLWAIEICHKL